MCIRFSELFDFITRHRSAGFSDGTIHLPLLRALPRESVFVWWWKIKPSVWCSFYWGSVRGCWNAFCVIGSWSKVLSISMGIMIYVNTYLSLYVVTNSSEAQIIPCGYPRSVITFPVRLWCFFFLVALFYLFFYLMLVFISCSACKRRNTTLGSSFSSL